MMINSRWRNALGLGVMTTPPFEECAKAAMAGSISPASRTLIGLASIRSDGAADWMAPNCPIPEAMAGSRRTATRVTRPYTGLIFWIVRGSGHEHADVPHPVGLLRAYRDRPRRRAAENANKL